MGFLKRGGFGKRDGMPGVEEMVAQPNDMAGKLGRLINRPPEDVSGFASRLGTGMNMIAAGGGAEPGYAGPAPMEQAPPMNNALQQLDPRFFQAFMQNFQGGRF